MAEVIHFDLLLCPAAGSSRSSAGKRPASNHEVDGGVAGGLLEAPKG